ncbi:MAG: DinB family protein [Thermoanaerobaculia bacterium]|nr:DinB family protein [Thermoanaerobaculia bacterium]
MHRSVRTALFCLLAPAALGSAQEGAPRPVAEPTPAVLIDHNESVFSGTRKIVLRAAELMPQEGYSFRPAESVRTYGQILEHIADSQYAFCSIVLGEESPAPDVEEPAGSKTGLIQALEEAFDYCGRAHAGMTGAAASELVTFQGAPEPRLGVLYVNQVHTIEHYGNLITYLRMNGIVPPTSDPEFMQQIYGNR